ncbi:MAG: SUMF1/EgtB/PvdO family nonheme iron enzyme [Planctomycetota bacterium]|jgi:formylglycine-generating enzyme required for sulfatase activity
MSSHRPALDPRPITLLLLALAAVATAPRPAAAQSWQVDPAAATVSIEGEAYADTCSNNAPMPPGNCVERPGPGDVTGLCPPLGWGWGLAWTGYPQFDWEHEPEVDQLFPNSSFFGPTIDFGALYVTQARDMSFFPNQAEANYDGWIYADGVGSRALTIGCFLEADGNGVDDDFFTRVCGRLTAQIVAEAVGLPTGALERAYIRHDFSALGETTNSHECEDPGTAPLCAAMLLPVQEDPSHASLTMTLDVGSNVSFPVPGIAVDNLGLIPPLPWQDEGTDSNLFTGVPVVDVTATYVGEVGQTLQFPEGLSTASDSSFLALLTLYIVTHEFMTEEPFDEYMRIVPAGGAGPPHALRAGRYEITNQQYADFLNSAEHDGGATGLGSHLAFAASGLVTLTGGDLAFDPAVGGRIAYDPAAALGTRYTVPRPLGADRRSYERHPVVGLSWLGAAKFCNWLTLKRGLPAGERCYAEGPDAGDWHPVTISAADWATRDLTDTERLTLVEQYRGFRLPMDDLGPATGLIGGQVSTFNEWYKAAAYDPTAPGIARFDPGGALVPARHWAFGFGRDTIGSADANYVMSGDPFDDDDAFVGLYDGALLNPRGGGDVGDGAAFAPTASANRYGMYDLSGNVSEWGQDQAGTPADRAHRGGGFADFAPDVAANIRGGAHLAATTDAIGFRVFQATCAGDVNFDGVVDVSDLLLVLATWGQGRVPADADGSGAVAVGDLLLVLARWGSC